MSGTRRSRIACIALLGGLAVGCQMASDRVWLDQALAHRELEQGNAGRAIELLDRCRRERPDYAPTYLSLAAAWAQRGDRQQFRENMAIYRRLNPTHEVADLYLAEAEFKEKEFDRAAELYEEFLTATSQQFESKTLSRRLHAFERLAEIAEHREDLFRHHLYLARMESTRAWWLAIQPKEKIGSSAGPGETSHREVRESLASALQELQQARSAAVPEEKGRIDQEIDLVRKMLEDEEAGRLTDLAYLLSARSDVETSPSPDTPPHPQAPSSHE